MDLSIIIVNWNSVAYLEKCLASVKANVTGIVYEVVVVDGGSFDGSDKMMAASFPEYRHIQSRDNLGFAKANNLGFQNSSGKALLFLNPDTEVIGAAIQAMLAQLELLPQVGLLGCKLLNTDGTIQTSCIQSYPTIINQILDSEFLRARSPRSALWGMAPLFSNRPEPAPVQAVIGACMLMKRELFEAVGGFSEDYFMYGEDIDLCYKISHAGFRNYYVPTVQIIHHGGKSAGQRKSAFSIVTMRESTWLFLRKFRGRCYAAVYRASMAVSAVVRLGLTTLLIPFLLVAKSRTSLQSTMQKWLAILGWSLRLNSRLD